MLAFKRDVENNEDPVISLGGRIASVEFNRTNRIRLLRLCGVCLINKLRPQVDEILRICLTSKAYVIIRGFNRERKARKLLLKCPRWHWGVIKGVKRPCDWACDVTCPTLLKAIKNENESLLPRLVHVKDSSQCGEMRFCSPTIPDKGASIKVEMAF
jgi:hypothetical protein